ncbi:MAG TPA: RNA polymerase sigma factor [Blastocatellia bacterium]|nr:RNA polymerase sigma factor [Blastocatellia bacterium]
MRGNRKSQTRADNRSAPTAAQSVIKEVEQASLHSSEPDEREISFAGVEVVEADAEGRDRGTDDEVIKRSLAGDQDAFESLVRRHSPRVFNIVGSFFRRRDMVEDIAQEVFAKAYFSLSSFTLGRSFEAWVARITVNACYDHLRAQRRRIEYQMPRSGEQEDEWFELQMLDVARDRHASAERQRDAAEVADRLLAKLTPEDRVVLVLIDRDGFSIKEVSEMTGWGESKIKVRAFRARRLLRGAMKRLLLNAERKQGKLKAGKSE